MAVTLRLARHGRKGIPAYRLVAADAEMPRDGRYLELLGTVNPMLQPTKVDLKEDRVKYWLGVGAKTSDTVAQILERQIPGYLSNIEEERKNKIRSRRAKRKARIKTKAKVK